MKTKQQGFTLIELIVAIIIIGLLAATALPKFMDYRKEAEIAALKANAGALASATQMNYGKWLTMKDNLNYVGRNGVIQPQEAIKSLINAGLSPVYGCGQNDSYGGGSINLEVLLQQNEIGLARHKRGSEELDGSKYILGIGGTTAIECLDFSDPKEHRQYDAIECPIYLAEKASRIGEYNCTEDNYCVTVKLSCLTGYPSNGKFLPMIDAENGANLIKKVYEEIENNKALISYFEGFDEYPDKAEDIGEAERVKKLNEEGLKELCKIWKKDNPTAPAEGEEAKKSYQQTLTYCTPTPEA